MILQDNKLDTLEGGLLDETTFSIDDSNMHIIFDILRSKVYRNPIGSICREIACNSRDAQREVGDFTTPIEIEIVDKRENFFFKDGLNIIFRDFGIGLSPQRVNDIYSKYGGSTKRGTNDLTGGFGLGAKTPFSYTDSFTVRTIVDSVEYVYTIYIDDSKKGKIALLYQQEVEATNNLTEIVIPLSSNNDRYKFEEEVIRNTFFWSIRPNLIGFARKYDDTLINEIYKLDKKANKKYIVTKRNNLILSDINVVIDGIYYSIDTNILKRDFKGYFSLTIFIDNGELSISANRENLQYDEPTIEKLNNYIDNILEDFEASIQTEIDKIPTIFEAKSYHNKNRYNQIYDACSGFKYKGLDLEGFYSIGNIEIIKYQYSQGKFERKKEDYLYNISVKPENIFYHSELTFRTDPQINETLKSEGTFVVLTPSKNIKEDDLIETLNRLKGEGLKLGSYYDIPKTKVQRAKVDKPIKTGITTYNLYKGNMNYSYDKATKSFSDLDLSKVVYFTRRRDGGDNTRSECLSELSKLIKEDITYLEISPSNEKYFLGATKMEDFINKNKEIIQNQWLRNHLDYKFSNINKLCSLGFQKELKKYTELYKDYPHYKRVDNIERMKVLEFKQPENVFESIEERYPLIFKIESDYRKEYIKLVNENIKLKNEKSLVCSN